MTNFLKVMQETDPKAFARATDLAHMSKDPELDPILRAVVFMELHDLCYPFMLEATNQNLAATPAEQKPQYKWVNGARVRIKPKV